MILSSTTRFIIQASNTGRYVKLMGNGRSYRLPGRNTVTTDLRLGKSQRAGALGGARITMPIHRQRASRSQARFSRRQMTKRNGVDWESAICACLQYKSKRILVNDDNAP